MNFSDYLTAEMTGADAKPSSYDEIFAELLAGQCTDAQIAAILCTWKIKGETAEILAAGAACLRKNATPIKLDPSCRPLSDNCGTGGDGLNTFNISTASAIVAAASGLKVAKHGNRSVSSKCGSADLLFEAGFPENLSAEATALLLKQTGFTFFFAPNFHPLIKNVMPVRRQLGIPTIFNQLGPLANPIAPDYQLIGVAGRNYLEPMANAAKSLGAASAWIVHSEDGLDEISPGAPAHIAKLEDGHVSLDILHPNDYGLSAKTEDLVGGDAKHNTKMLHSLLGGEKSATRNAVILNSAALLVVSKNVSTFKDGVELATAAIDKGIAKTFFTKWIARAKEL